MLRGAAPASRGRRLASPRFVALEALAEAVALALQQQDRAAVHEPVEERGRHPLMPEDLRPAREVQVRGDADARPLVAVGEELEDQLGGVLGEGQVADLIDEDQVEASQLRQQFREPQLLLGEFQLAAAQAGGAAEPEEEMGLPDPARAE